MCERPFYVIGVGRSGTTLLRVMLDEHSRLAIPGEAPWVTSVDPSAGVRGILAHPRFGEWELDPAAVMAAVERHQPETWPDLIDTLFCAVAARRSKPRWGDKTPSHIDHLAKLARWFPDAAFVHIIRDGRAVAASLAEQPWGPRNAMAGAFYWRHAVSRARRIGRRLGHRYHEVRLEDLVADPEQALGAICTFLGEDYEPAMLEYPRTVRAKGGILERAHRHLADPPTAGLRDPHAGLRPVESRAVEAVCRPLLRDLGYPVGPLSPTGWVVARADRARGAARRLNPTNSTRRS